MILSTLVADFLEHLELEKHSSMLTIRNYDHCLKRFLRFVGDIEVENLDLPLIKKYRLHLARYKDPHSGEPLKKATQNLDLIALRSLLNFLARNSATSVSAMDVLLSPVEPRIMAVLGSREQNLLLSCPNTSKKDGIRDRAILEVLISTGLRVSELTGLNKDQLQSAEFEITGKGGKKRTVVLPENALTWIKKYLSIRKDNFNPLFIRFQGKISPLDGGEAMRLTSRSIERIVEKYVKRLRLEIKATPRSLRHAFAAKSLRDGTNAISLQKMLGFNNIASTKLYARLF